MQHFEGCYSPEGYQQFLAYFLATRSIEFTLKMHKKWLENLSDAQ